MDAASRREASSSGRYTEKHTGGDTGENGIDKTLIGDVMLQHREEAANETLGHQQMNRKEKKMGICLDGGRAGEEIEVSRGAEGGFRVIHRSFSIHGLGTGNCQGPDPPTPRVRKQSRP
ncbi:Os02g0243000 [Oryza sativa Japonica Group]|uniref:Os02g0243000 protein n=1 Tax=Oryza sativa subsp. japonica TaxID=39947 RepID=A0A0P0VH09_ORYSJ|nr:Os02g0243000 [Oryza sativa Japonica Group]